MDSWTERGGYHIVVHAHEPGSCPTTQPTPEYKARAKARQQTPVVIRSTKKMDAA